MTRITAAIGLLLAAGVLWLAGETHRENCQRENRAGCSVLPWDNGDTPTVTGSPVDDATQAELDAQP